MIDITSSLDNKVIKEEAKLFIHLCTNHLCTILENCCSLKPTAIEDKVLTEKEIYDIIKFYENQPTIKQMRKNLKLEENGLIKWFQNAQN